MIDYVTVGANDLARSAAFYDAIARVLGHARMFETERMVAWGTPEKTAMMGAITPLDGEPATGGNGSMFGLRCEREEQVHAIYDHVLANGGKVRPDRAARPSTPPIFAIPTATSCSRT
jgi:hypothetical protein